MERRSLEAGGIAKIITLFTRYLFYEWYKACAENDSILVYDNETVRNNHSVRTTASKIANFNPMI